MNKQYLVYKTHATRVKSAYLFCYIMINTRNTSWYKRFADTEFCKSDVCFCRKYSNCRDFQMNTEANRIPQRASLKNLVNLCVSCSMAVLSQTPVVPGNLKT
jgi:hypothetical protein